MVVFCVRNTPLSCDAGSTDYQTLHERELKLVEEETQRRIKCLLEGTSPGVERNADFSLML